MDLTEVYTSKGRDLVGGRDIHPSRQRGRQACSHSHYTTQSHIYRKYYAADGAGKNRVISALTPVTGVPSAFTFVLDFHVRW